MTHENEQAAREACIKYSEQKQALQEPLGIFEENDDPYVTTSVCAIYIDEHGKRQKFIYDGQ